MTALLRWNSSGQTVAGIGAPAGTASNQLDYPIDLVIDSLCTLYIADYNNNRIQKWLYNAINGTTIAGRANGTGGSNATDLKNPSGVDVDSNGNIYVADFSNHRIQLWPKDVLTGMTIAGTGTFKNNSCET
jgi:hypothetical protein